MFSYAYVKIMITLTIMKAPQTGCPYLLIFFKTCQYKSLFQIFFFDISDTSRYFVLITLDRYFSILNFYRFCDTYHF